MFIVEVLILDIPTVFILYDKAIYIGTYLIPKDGEHYIYRYLRY